ncbi:MAG TPA: VWA domain-containing protein, partial [Pyrinomonadaceae bacterium]
IAKIDGSGSSPVRDSLSYIFANVLKPEPGRRSAIVFMTDADDTASQRTFADEIEEVRHHDTTIYSVFLNTTFAKPSQRDYAGRITAKYQATLRMLADETGGQFYAPRELKDLNGIYEQIIQDVSNIYTLGYEPKNERHDGGWRAIDVKVKDKPALTAKTRRGYYAN